MAKNVSISPAAGLFGNKDTNSARDVPHVHEEHEVHKGEKRNLNRAKYEMPRSQGIKGEKLPRIHMAYSSENYEFLHSYPRMLGLSMTEYVNMIIDVARKKAIENKEWNP